MARMTNGEMLLGNERTDHGSRRDYRCHADERFSTNARTIRGADCLTEMIGLSSGRTGYSRASHTVIEGSLGLNGSEHASNRIDVGQ